MIIERLRQEVFVRGDQCRVVPAGRLKDLREDIEEFRNSADLNGFQEFITSQMYQFGLTAPGFEVRSVLIMAAQVPSYANLVFHWRGSEISAKCLAQSYVGKPDAAAATKQYLTDLLIPAGFHIAEARQLPLKRLAVRSGLAAYGRNNICFVEGMGSFLTLVAYLSDLEPADEEWRDVGPMDKCSSCTACLKNCPTGAILKERFLIDNERCLSYFNESAEDFPQWLAKSVHHCLYDCLRCQEVCPANREVIGNVIGPIEFDATETDLLLSGVPMDGFPADLEQKVKFLGMDKWIRAIPRNLRILLENCSAG